VSNVLSADIVVKSLRDEGLTVVEVRSWRTNNRNHKGSWGPVNGVMIHHTVTSGIATTVDLCYQGRSDLPGPLCHGVIAKDGTVYLVGYGRANHAGAGDPDVLAAVVAESTQLPAPEQRTTDGNARFYGFECINLGDGKDPWPEVQLDAIERASAALCRVHGWRAASVIGHLEWTNQKIDPRGFAMTAMRQRVAERLAHAADWDGSEEDDMPTADEIAKAVWTHKLTSPTAAEGTDPLREAGTFLRYTDAKQKALLDALSLQRQTTDKLVEAVATLAANIGDLDPAAIVNELRAAIESIDIRLDLDPSI
jgi:hypothetical protein